MTDGRPYGSSRTSPARRTIVRVVDSLGSAFTVDDLAEECRHVGSPVALATTYRAVAALEASGWIARVGEREGVALWARCVRDGHHHHIVCTSCGRVEHTRCPLGHAALEDAARKGFVITRHQVEIYGLCRECLDRPRVPGDGRD